MQETDSRIQADSEGRRCLCYSSLTEASMDVDLHHSRWIPQRLETVEEPCEQVLPSQDIRVAQEWFEADMLDTLKYWRGRKSRSRKHAPSEDVWHLHRSVWDRQLFGRNVNREANVREGIHRAHLGESAAFHWQPWPRNMRVVHYHNISCLPGGWTLMVLVPPTGAMAWCSRTSWRGRVPYLNIHWKYSFNIQFCIVFWHSWGKYYISVPNFYNLWLIL